jgi:hypothetical protein
MTAGHVLLKILAGFTVFVFSSLIGVMFDTNSFFTSSEEVVRHLQFNLVEHSLLTFSLIKIDFFLCMCMANNCNALLSIDNLLNNGLPQQSVLVYDYSNLTAAQCVSYLLLINDQTRVTNYLAWFVPTKITSFASFLFNKTDLFFLSFQFDFIVNFFYSVFSLLFAISVFSLLITILILFVSLELFVAVLQAYVFSILLVIYLRDMFELH